MTSCILWFCAPAGHFAAAAFAPLLDLRFCHCLAGPRFGNPARFPRCLRFAEPRYTERILRWLQRFTFHLSLSYTLLEVSWLARNGSSPAPRIGFFMEPLRINYYWPTSNRLLLCCSIISIRTFSLLFLLHLRTSRSGVGAFFWDFTKALLFHICVYLYFPTLA